MSNAIEIKDVTMSFNLEQEKTDTLKEYLLKLAKRQLKYTEFKALDGVSFSVEKGDAVALIGFLMFGNLIRECGVLQSLSETAQKVLANLITILLGLTISSRMTAEAFLRPQTLLIMGLGLVAFVVDTVGGILLAKLMNLFARQKINPMIGAAGISAFPMSARVVHKIGQEEDAQNFLLMHAVGVNVSGQIASVIAGGLLLSMVM